MYGIIHVLGRVSGSCLTRYPVSGKIWKISVQNKFQIQRSMTKIRKKRFAQAFEQWLNKLCSFFYQPVKNINKNKNNIKNTKRLAPVASEAHICAVTNTHVVIYNDNNGCSDVLTVKCFKTPINIA